MLSLVDSFFDKQLAFLWDQTVPHYWLTCFSIPMTETEFSDELINESKRKLSRKFSL